MACEETRLGWMGGRQVVNSCAHVSDDQEVRVIGRYRRTHASVDIGVRTYQLRTYLSVAYVPIS
jgi:hypothetical protein